MPRQADILAILSHFRDFLGMMCQDLAMNDGLLLIDKPAQMTSHDVVDRVRRIAQTRAVGHAGTLDPFATGLLILGLNKGTKQLTGLVGLDKRYEATAILGATSDTFDREGVIVSKPEADALAAPLDQTVIERVFDQFRGGYDQQAPLFSAKKLKGKKLYELARAGQADESMRPTKHVLIHELKLIEFTWPKLRFEVHVSSGTYIRSLADDIGRALGVGAYLEALRRLTIGSFEVDQAIPLAELTSENWKDHVFSLALDKGEVL